MTALLDESEDVGEPRKPPAPCSTAGCTRPATYGHAGRCQRCYQRGWRSAMNDPRPPPEPGVRFVAPEAPGPESLGGPATLPICSLALNFKTWGRGAR